MKAYNTYNGTNYQFKITSMGYQMSEDGIKSYANTLQQIFDNSEGTYNSAIVLTSNDIDGQEINASCRWLASPGNTTTHILWAGVTSTTGYTIIGNTMYNNTSTGWSGGGFRPIICLSNSVQLEKQSDGSLKIK